MAERVTPAWRKRPATRKQLDLLARLLGHRGDEARGHQAPGMTRGEASDLIAKLREGDGAAP